MWCRAIQRFYMDFGGVNMKIYVVTKGYYSDYHIITATTDEELAYRIKEKFSGDYYGEAKVEIFEDAEIFMKSCYFIKFDKGGNVIRIEEEESEYSYEQYESEDTKGNFYISIIADNKERAIKIAAERRSMYLAQKYGL